MASDLRVSEGVRQFLPADIEGEHRLQNAWGIKRFRPIGMHVVSPDGTLIASSACPLDSQVVLQFLRRALHGHESSLPRSVAPSGPARDRGYGLQPDGSARLAVTIRAMDHGRPADSPVLDSIRLTASQLKAMAPPNAVSGTRYALPAGASREFVRALTDTPDLTYALRAQDATAAHFEAQVVSVAATEVVVRIHGTLAGDRPSQGAPHSIKSRSSVMGSICFRGRTRLTA